MLQNKFKAKDRQQIEQLPKLPIRDAGDEIGEVVSEKEKKVFDFLDKYKQKNLKDISDIEKEGQSSGGTLSKKEIEYQEKSRLHLLIMLT